MKIPFLENLIKCKELTNKGNARKYKRKTHTVLEFGDEKKCLKNEMNEKQCGIEFVHELKLNIKFIEFEQF